jgi:hypothetical protein
VGLNRLTDAAGKRHASAWFRASSSLLADRRVTVTIDPRFLARFRVVLITIAHLKRAKALMRDTIFESMVFLNGSSGVLGKLAKILKWATGCRIRGVPQIFKCGYGSFPNALTLRIPKRGLLIRMLDFSPRRNLLRYKVQVLARRRSVGGRFLRPLPTCRTLFARLGLGIRQAASYPW